MSQIIADAIATECNRKPFQYAGHYKGDHQYSPFHHKLDAALKHFYSKSNLATVLIKKGLLDFKNLNLLDHATVDVWANVVWGKNSPVGAILWRGDVSESRTALLPLLREPRSPSLSP